MPFRNDFREHKGWIVGMAGTEDQLKIGIILLKKTFQIFLEIRFEAVDRLQNADCRPELASVLQHLAPVLRKFKHASDHQQEIYRGRDCAEYADPQQQFRKHARLRFGIIATLHTSASPGGQE